MRSRLFAALLAATCLCGLSQAHAQLTINTANATDWKIANGELSMDFDSTTGSVWSMYLAGSPTNLVDTTHSQNGHPSGLYMDNDGSNAGGVTPTAGYKLQAGSYLDWWVTYAANAANPLSVSEHFILQPNDATLYSYYVVNHAATAPAANFGQIQYVYRVSNSEFTNTYSVNSGLNNTGATAITLPSQAVLGTTDPGRNVQNAVTDLHGLTLPAGFGREFYTKYDYSSYEYLHQAHGVYGANFGAWTILPSTESLAAGPTKQDLIFTENVLMGELLSGHLNNELTYTPTQGVATTRVFGPVGFHFNAFNATLKTPAALYQDALNAIPGALKLFSADATLTGSGYVPATARGSVEPFVTGAGSPTPNAAWAVLSDPGKNFQYSSNGSQYWSAMSANGNSQMYAVVPGKYRLSAYVLGQWGELRDDAVTVTAGAATALHGLVFKPENFSTAAPVFTIGTPDRSAHEFLHGKNAAGADDREFYGNWNYWADFASTNGAVNYYATAVGLKLATNNLNAWNYAQWTEFDPGLYAGVSSPSDDSTDGYKYVIPSYVAHLPGANGINGVSTSVPAWQVHFTTTAAQRAQGAYVDLSVGLAAADSDLIVALNGHTIVWHGTNYTDASVRSGLSGYYQWIAYEWPASDLLPAGQDNVLTFSVKGATGVMYDALRLEISANGANPSVTGWHDYEYVTPSVYVPANDAVPNNF